MRVFIVVLPLLKYDGMTLFPFILIKNQHLKADHILIQHETIHWQQQLELLVIPFYVLYIANYVVNLLRYKDHNRAYRQIVFEREAYHHECDSDYIKYRKRWNWLHYIHER